MLTLADIRERISYIEGVKGDDESAHLAEDRLRTEVLAAIANGNCEDDKQAAVLALTTADIDFARWCA